MPAASIWIHGAGEIERRIDAVLGCARKFRCSPEDLPAC
jgi:hypothetical protein